MRSEQSYWHIDETYISDLSLWDRLLLYGAVPCGKGMPITIFLARPDLHLGKVKYYVLVHVVPRERDIGSGIRHWKYSEVCFQRLEEL